MKKMLENLWYSYQEENFSKQSKEEKKILNVLIDNEEKLRASLNEEQKEWLQNYEIYMNERVCISEKNAFIEGIRFSANFLAEAFYKGEK